MFSFSDLSQISDISRISRSNSSRIIGRVDSLYNLLEHQSSILQNASKSTVNLNHGVNCLEKTAKSFSTCEGTLVEYVKNKMIFDRISEASVDGKKSLPENISSKLKGLLSIYEMNKYMRLQSMLKNAQEQSNVLGITDLPKYELSCEEKLEVKRYVQALLREKIQDFLLKHDSSGNRKKDILGTTEYNVHQKLFAPQELETLEWKDKIDELCTQYKADILKCKGLMNDWNEYKSQMSQISLQKAEYLLLKAKVAKVQTKITKLSCIMKMFSETPATTAAYRMLNAAVDEKLFAIISEIREKEDLKQLYEDLRNSEYDEILKTYLHYCKVVKKKRQILEKI